MRIFLTSLMAFLLSGFAGGMVAQWLAVATNATEEYILVFAATVMITIGVTMAFFIAQFFGDAPRAVNRTAITALILFAIALVVLVGWSYMPAGSAETALRDLPIIAGLILPGVVTILVHWLFVRWRVKNTAPAFGRLPS